ncbi:MAG: cyclic nucleotide-binding domain-containing protein [Mariprofundaceae bacterium]|nr:cyclic nucleotide-binding domain-containing protein [Mariprofundaceae bacterium]
MDDMQVKELEHKEVLYRQMIDLYPNDPKYLRRLVELLLQLDREDEAISRMRQLERIYKNRGEKGSAKSLKDLRHSISGSDDTHSGTLNPFLSGIKPEAISMLMRDVKRIQLNENETLIKQGDTDDSMYIVLDGELAVLVLYRKQNSPRLVHILREGAIVGEIAFLEGRSRSASIIANTRASVLMLSSKWVLKCLLKFPEVGDYLRQESDFRKHLTAINGNVILARLPDEAKADLALHAKTMHYPPFAVISRSEKKLRWVGIMISGLVRIVAEDSLGQSHVLEPVKPGGTIADVAALQDETSIADMVTVTDTAILQIPAEKFRSLMEDNPSVKTRLLEDHAKRISTTMVYIKNKTG